MTKVLARHIVAKRRAQDSAARAAMEIVTSYSFAGGQDFIEEHHPGELEEIVAAITSCDAVWCFRKASREKTMPGRLLFSPFALNDRIKSPLHANGWATPSPGSKKGYREPRILFAENRFREMDGIKNRVGLEVQFGKYSFMGYDIFAKMPIFHRKGLIECGVEVVATQALASHMSTGVSEFEQILIDFEYRGESNTDIPVLVYGIGPSKEELRRCREKQQRFRADPKKLIANGEVDRARDGTVPGPK